MVDELCENGHLLCDALEAIKLPSSTYYDHRKRDHKESTKRDVQKDVIRDIIEDHPAYGYRRIQPEYEARTGEVINHKALLDRLNDMELALSREVSRSERSGVQTVLDRHKGQLNLVAGWDPGLLECLSTDFTEIQYDNGSRKAWMAAYIDVNSGWLAGWAVGSSANRDLAGGAWDHVLRRFEQLDREIAGTVVHSDQDSVYKSYDYVRRIVTESGCVVSFSENGCKDNPWIESRWGRMKVEIESRLIEAQTETELREVINEENQYYNQERRHSSIDYMTPVQYLESEGLSARSVTLNRGQKVPS
jgi:transposase InsO family protein